MTYEEASRRQAEALRDKKGVRILALETSCDETAAAVIEDGRKILSNIVFSQIDHNADRVASFCRNHRILLSEQMILPIIPQGE